MVALHGWRGRAEKRDGVFHFCAHDGDVAAVIARRLFLLVAALLLLVDDDEANVFKRCKNRRARAHYDAGFAVSNAPPFAGPLDVAQGRVQDRDALESRAKPGTSLAAVPKRQVNLGDKNDGLVLASESLENC